MARVNVGSRKKNKILLRSFQASIVLFLLNPKVSPSNVGKSDRVIISAALLGLVNGMTECGNVFGCK